MILIVTLNPLLEKRLTYDTVTYGSVNRNPSFVNKPGGKGINVSRQLKKLGLSSYNLIFSGGVNGKVYKDILRKEGFEFSSIQTESETRFGTIVIDRNTNLITSYFSKDPVITGKESDEFISRLEKMIRNCEMIIFSGSAPEGAEHIISEGIKIANGYDKVSVCDTYGKHLFDSIKSSPTVIHNNFNEIDASLNIKLYKEQEVLSVLNSFYDKGIKRSYLTNGPNTFYASNFNYHYKIHPPEINSIDSTGSGDSFVAGIIYGWHNNLVFEDSLRFATALAAINATTFEVSNVNPDEARSLSTSVKIENAGKKIKTIDDSPH